LRTTTAMASDRRIFLTLKSCYLFISPKKLKSAKKNSFFSTLNQYFPHIPYASKKGLN
jgi:hypothetical protein